MDEYYCKARPHFSLLPFFPSSVSSVSSTYLNTQQQTISSDHIYFNIQLEYTINLVPTDGTQSFGYTRYHVLYHVSMEQIMRETTFASWFSKTSLPKGAVRLVFEETLRCANDMVAYEKDLSGVLIIRVDLVVTSLLEDEEEMEVEENNCLNEDEEEIEVEEEEEEEEEEHNELVPARAIEDESFEVYRENSYGYDGFYEDEEEMEVEEEEEEDNELDHANTTASDGEISEYNYGYEGNNGFEEDEEEEMMDDEEYNGFIPAAKSCIEELEILKVEEAATCVICFEEFNIGVQLPCSHMFHSNCIHDWLVVGNCCPLCRFQFPTANISD